MADRASASMTIGGHIHSTLIPPPFSIDGGQAVASAELQEAP